jgi:hypothetical protein
MLRQAQMLWGGRRGYVTIVAFQSIIDDGEPHVEAE